MTDQVFVFGKPVEDNAFTDREKESARLAANFAGGINTFIISPRRWGKTSLVKKVIRETDGEKILCVFADVFMAKTPEDFCEILGNAILKQSASAVDEFIDNAKKFLGRIDLWVEDILNLPERIAEKKDIRIVVCIDEFQQITEFAESLSFQKLLRTVWQHQKRVSYCLFGSKKHMMEGLFDEPSKPFYKFGDIIYLKRIPLSYWEEYISGKFKTAGKAISEDQIERICQVVDFHSSYVQQLCWYVYLFSDDVVTHQNIDAGIEELIDQNTALFESRTENLTPVQMRFLKAVARGIHSGFSSAEVISRYKLGSSAASVSTKKALLEKGLVYCEDGQCLLADPVMGLWINR